MNIKNKLLSALALAVIAFPAAAQSLDVAAETPNTLTAIAEVDFHKLNKTDDRSTYWATGLAYGTKYGTFDVYAQGVHAYGPGYYDNLHGFEVGYTVPGLTIGSALVMPRIAYGEMGNIGQPDGTNGTGKYILGSVELNAPLVEGLNGYVSVSHMSGQNVYAIQSQNRAQIGVDIVLTEKAIVRVGYSAIRQYQTTQQGLVTMLFVSF